MTENPLYYPLLPSKDGEIEGAAHLSKKEKDLVLPIVEVLPFPNPKKSLDKAFAFCQKWGNDVIVDVSKIDKNTTLSSSLFSDNLISLIFDTLSGHKLPFIPSITLGQPSKGHIFRDLFKRGYSSTVCIRAKRMSIRNSHNLNSAINDLLRDIDMSCEDTYLILDLEYISPPFNLEYFMDLTAQTLMKIDMERFNEVILLSSSFSMQNVKVDSTNETKRVEMELWKELKEIYPLLMFGDYGITGVNQLPEGPFSPSGRISPKIRCSTPESYVIMKGNTKAERPEQYPDLARKMIEIPSGPDKSSWGDRNLIECSKSSFFNGSLAKWVGIDTNRHLHHTVKHLEAIDKKRVNWKRRYSDGDLQLPKVVG